MHEREDDFERGLKNRRAVLGDAWVDKSLGSADAFNADFQSLITRYAWNDIWGRPGLDHTTRRLLVLGMTMGLARWEEFELHCGAAIRAGVPLEMLQETLMQGAIYCGVPAANTAFRIAGEQLKAHGLLPGPDPLTDAARVATHHTFSAPQLKVALQGRGAPVVLSHALGLDMAMWDALAARLAAGELGAPREVLRFDHRGHGGSAAPAGPYAMDELVDDAARLVREWGSGPVTWIGLSMGAMVGMGLAIRHPELVDRLVLANTTAQYPDAAQPAWAQRIAAVAAGGMAAVVEMVVERYLQAGFRTDQPAATQAIRAAILRNDPAAYAASCNAVAGVAWQDRLAEIRCPTLVISGARDAGAPPPMGQAIAERIPGARFEVIADASHLSVLETPDEFEALLRAFL
ncbi:MAG: alpha/beta fold hydrolase [Burkholderiaceae bacterium]|jgi:3-oxoadipate enol-lactonase